MVVTFAVFHLERSELNTDALSNAVEVKAMVDPIQNKSRRGTKKWGSVRKQNSNRKKQRTEEQSSAVDVLYRMVVTSAVFHLERSALNVDLLLKTDLKLVTLATFQSSMGPYVVRTVFLAAPPLIQSDTTLRRPVPGSPVDPSPFGNGSNALSIVTHSDKNSENSSATI